MKRIYRILALVLIAVTLGTALTACGNPAKPFLGKWDAYQVSTNGTNMVFADMAQLIKMELNVTFYEDGTYVVHYYVNGQEGSAYPQAGSYTVEGETLTLDGGGTGTIENGELILTYSGADGSVKQYYRKVT